MAEGEYLVAPKNVWSQGRKACDRLQSCRAPELGMATLREWLAACVEAEELLPAVEEEAQTVEEGEAETEEVTLIDEATDIVTGVDEIVVATPTTPMRPATPEQEVFGPALWECLPIVRQTKKQRNRNKG